MILQTNHASVFNLEYVLYLTTNTRPLNFEYKEILENSFNKIASNHNVVLSNFAYTDDYVQINFSAEPNTNLSKFINAYKSASGRYMRNLLQQEENFWHRSYYLITLNTFSEDNLSIFLNKQRKGL